MVDTNNFTKKDNTKSFFVLVSILLLLLYTSINLYLIFQTNLSQNKSQKVEATTRSIGLSNDLIPDAVLGQKDFKQTSNNEIVPNKIGLPEGIAVDKSVKPNRVYIWDGFNSRVLGFSSIGSCLTGPNMDKPCTNSSDCDGRICDIDSTKSPDIIIGQPDGYSGACNGDNTKYVNPTAKTLCGRHYPRVLSQLESEEATTLSTDNEHNFYIFDKWNNRVLKYNDPFATDTEADFVWGQPDFTSRECNQNKAIDNQTICGNADTKSIWINGDNTSSGVDVDKYGNVWVTDQAYNRVLRFPPNSKNADLVVGQDDFNTIDNSGCNVDESRIGAIDPPLEQESLTSKLCRPKSVQYDDTTDVLYILDWPHPTKLSRITVYLGPFQPGVVNRSFTALVIGLNNEYQFSFNRPTAITLDPSLPNAIWVNDSGYTRLVLIQIDGVKWRAVKLLGREKIDKYASWGGSECDKPVNSYPWLCMFRSVGSIGIDDQLNFFVGNEKEFQVYHFSSPIPNIDLLQGKAYTADRVILQSQYDTKIGQEPLPNSISSKSLFIPNWGVFLENIGRDQLVITDQKRILFWNNYKTISVSKPADGILYQPGFNLQLGATITALTSDLKKRLWIARYNLPIDIFISPLASNQKPYFNIPQELPFKQGGSIKWITPTGLAYDNKRDILWLADWHNYRILRIRNPLDVRKRNVDLIIGQPDMTTKTPHCNGKGIGADAFGFGNIIGLKIDKSGNLFVIDGQHEGWDCSNNRVLEFDAVDLNKASGFPFDQLKAKRVYAKDNFTDTVDQNPKNPQTPISVGFNKLGQMIMTVDGYGNGLNDRLFLYDKPTPFCSRNCSVPYSRVLPIETAQPSDVFFDSEGNMGLPDHSWSRVLYFKKPF